MLYRPDSDETITWICDECEAVLNDQDGFNEECAEWKCTKCGFINQICESEIYLSEDEFQEAKKNPLRGLSNEDVIRLSSYQDIEYFEVGNLLSDGTFLYCYTTKVGDLPTGSETDNRKIVHCAAAYNYKSEGGQFKVFHENTFTRVNEDSESFYMQLCSSDGDGDIFIYDNGIGYLYNASGEKKYEAKIEEFVRKHFKGYSIVTTQALTDGQNRIYVDLAIEKTEISAAPESTNTGSNNSNDDDAVEKEAEALDKEFSDKLIEIVLVYDIKEYSGSIDQTNLKLDDQIKYWQELRDIETGYEGWTPSAETDWEDTLKAIPDEWGAAHLYFLPNWNENQLEEKIREKLKE